MEKDIFPSMNTLTILLGATFGLLLVAVLINFSGMKEGVANAPADEVARLRKQLDQLQVEQERLNLNQQLKEVRSNPAPPAAPPAAAPSELDAMKAQLAAVEAEKEALQAEKELAEKQADTFKEEAGLIGQRDLEKSDDELRRARLIRDALLIGRITQYVTNPDIGGFATVEILLPEHVQVGTVLAIRRNTGILGKLEITDLTAEGGIGNPMPGFGPIEPEEGDELIIPPQV